MQSAIPWVKPNQISEWQKGGGGTLPGTRSNRQKAVVSMESFASECIAEQLEIGKGSALIYAFKNVFGSCVKVMMVSSTSFRVCH